MIGSFSKQTECDPQKKIFTEIVEPNMKRDDSSKKEEFYWLFFIDGCVFEFIKIFTNFLCGF